MKSPSILVTFKQLAESLINRSSKGHLVVIARDSQAAFTKCYKSVDEFLKDSAKMTQTNFSAIQDAWLGSPATITVIKLGTTGTVEEAIAEIKGLSFHWLTMLSDSPVDHDALVVWVKAQNLKRFRKIKVLTYLATVTDDMHVVNFKTSKVRKKGATTDTLGYLYLARLAGVFAGLPYTRSGTYYKLTDLESASEEDDLDAEIEAGYLCLTNMEGQVFIARAVTSLQTGAEDLKSIAIVEGMDLMSEDIRTTFRDNYVGQYKNSSSWRNMFLSAVNDYFRSLQAEEILDPDTESMATINTEAVIAYEMARGNDVSALPEAQIKEISTGKKILAKAKVKFLEAIEDLDFEINM